MSCFYLLIFYFDKFLTWTWRLPFAVYVKLKVYLTVVSSGTFNYAVPGGSNFRIMMKSWTVTVQMKATEQYFPVVLFSMLY